MNYQSVARLGARAWRVAAGAAAGAAMALAVPSQALAVAHGVLTLDQPTGTAGVTDVIDIFVTLRLDADSAPLVRVPAPGGGPLFTSGGLTLDELSGAGYDLSQPITQSLSLTFSCFSGGTPPTGLFLCSAQPPSTIYYTGKFAGPLAPSGPSSLAADTPVSFRFAQLTPKDPPPGAPPGFPIGVPPGSYHMDDIGIGFTVLGKDLGGNSLRQYFNVARVCGGCVFSRDVGLAAPSAAPEPTSWALMIGGFSLAGGFLRRRRVAA